MLVDWVIFAGVYFSLGIDLLSLRAIPMAIRDAWKLIHIRYPFSNGQLSPVMNLVVNSGSILGMGNLTFTALAILMAGPGVVLWSVVSGLVGFGTRFLEAYLSVRHREKNELGEYVGGPMYYLKAILPQSFAWMAALFAFFSIISMVGVGNLAQMHSLAYSLKELASTPLPVAAFLGAAVIGLVIVGGLHRVARFNVLLIPLAIVVNLVFCLVVIALHIGDLPGALLMIFEDAVSPKAMVGGSMTMVIDVGIRSGVFTNGAGLGREVVLQASAQPSDPFYQGCVSLVVGLLDLVLVVLTSLVVVMSGTYTMFKTPSLVLWNAFEWGIAGSGWLFFLISIPMALTTMATFSVIGERSFDFLFGVKRRLVYRLLWIVGVVVAPAMSIDFIKYFYAIANAMQCLPNLVGLIVVSPVLFPEIRDRFESLVSCKQRSAVASRA